MFKKQISYVDFNGTERTEDFYFHLSTPEATRIEAKLGGVSMDTYARSLAVNQNVNEMVAFIEELILSSYGRKSMDGKSFLKTKEIRTEFEYSQAYAELFEEMLTNPTTAETFATGISTQTKDMNAKAPEVKSGEGLYAAPVQSMFTQN